MEQKFNAGFVKTDIPVRQLTGDVKWEVCWAKERSKEEVEKGKLRCTVATIY